METTSGCDNPRLRIGHKGPLQVVSGAGQDKLIKGLKHKPEPQAGQFSIRYQAGGKRLD